VVISVDPDIGEPLPGDAAVWVELLRRDYWSH
jgi:hypothetical protein